MGIGRLFHDQIKVNLISGINHSDYHFQWTQLSAKEDTHEISLSLQADLKELTF